MEVRKIPVEPNNFQGSSSCSSGVSRALVYKGRKPFSDGRVLTKDNETVGRPTLTDEKMLTLAREVID